MENIIILGSTGKLGYKLKEYLEAENKIYLDKFISMEKLISLDFITDKKISCIINCVGSTKKSEYFFHSNFLFTSFLSEELKAFDLNLSQKLTFIHISTIGVNAPYMKYNFKKLNLKPCKKQFIKYNSYELSKSCGEYNLIKNLENLKNTQTTILQPSNIIFEESLFCKKLKIFLTFFPFKVNKERKLPITPIDFLLKETSKIISNASKNTFEIKKVYKRQRVYDLFKSYSYISFLKIKISFSFLKSFIKSLPEFFFIKEFKRFMIFIFVL